MRAQTTLDFAIGVTLFLTVMLFVFAFVPGILEPFALSGEQDTVLAERLASRISQGALGDPANPYVLGTTCTIRFFEGGTASPPFCDYDGTELSDRLGVADSRNVNVSIEGTLSGTDRDLLCWDATGERLVEANDADCGDDANDQLLAGGGVPPETNDATVTSRRVASLNRENVTVKVVVW